MAKLDGGRDEFRDWVDQHGDPLWKLMPLTHMTKGVHAKDIVKNRAVKVRKDSDFGEDLAYLFYARPAYRVHGDGPIKMEAACPFCFIFKPEIIEDARATFAFDTGAFSKGLYNRFLTDEMDLEDFSLGNDTSRPNRIIAKIFQDMAPYIRGDISKIPAAEQLSTSWDYHARSYINLLKSPGRNESDDRICSIEVVFDKDVITSGNLIAVIVPHTHWEIGSKAPWLQDVQKEGSEIIPYLFIPGRHPDYYYSLIEAETEAFYYRQSFL